MADRTPSDAASRPRAKQNRPPMLTLAKSASITFRPTASNPHAVDEETSSGLMWAVAARRGRRRAQREDMYAALPFADDADVHRPLSIFAVFDGHGGATVARHVSRRLPQLLLRRLQQQQAADHPAEALARAFLDVDAEVVRAAHRENQTVSPATPRPAGSELASVALATALSRRTSARFAQRKSTLRRDSEGESNTRTLSRGPSGGLKRAKSRAAEQVSGAAIHPGRSCGTTATVALLVGARMHVAHVGDSRALLVDQNGVQRLSDDHRPGRRDEMERIERAGGLVVEVSGSWRVNGVLAVSRAIGDVGMKEFVIANPEICEMEVRGVLVVASDGLWDYVDDEDCGQVVRETLEEGEEQVARTLVQRAWEKGSSDDVSVVVVNLEKYLEVWKTTECTEEEVVEEVEFRNDRLDDRVVASAVYPLETPRARGPPIW